MEPARDISISIRVRSWRTILVILIPWALGALGMAILIAYGIIESNRWDGALMFAASTCCLASILVIRAVLWMIHGCDTIGVVGEEMVLGRIGSFWMPAKRISLSEIDSVKVGRDSAPFWLRVLGFGHGRIHVHSLGRISGVGRGLGDNEANDCCSRIMRMIEVAESSQGH